MAEGYVYILFNPSLRSNRLKIGMTTKFPKTRAAEISAATGVPEPFEVAYERRVSDCRRAEREISAKLEALRISASREFYEVALHDAVKILNSVADEVDAMAARGTDQGVITPQTLSAISPPQLEDAGQADVDFDVNFQPLITSRTSSSGSSTKSGGKKTMKTIEEHLSVCRRRPDLRDLCKSFSKRIREIDPSIREEIWTYGLAYYAGAKRKFVEVHFRSDRLLIFLLPGNYNDPKRLLVDLVSDGKGWQPLNRQFKLDDEEQLDYLMFLVRQCWEGER